MNAVEGELVQLRAENGRLREENRRLRADRLEEEHRADDARYRAIYPE